MGWDRPFDYYPSDGDAPTELLGLLTQHQDELHHVTLARRKASGGKCQRTFYKFATFEVGDEDPEQICAELLGAAEAVIEADGADATNKFQAEIAWQPAGADGEPGKMERRRVGFDMGSGSGATRPSSSSGRGCPGCEAFRLIVRQQGQELARAHAAAEAERTRYTALLADARARERELIASAVTRFDAERDKRDELANKLVGFGLDMTRDTEVTSRSMGVLSGGIAAFESGMKLQQDLIDSMREGGAKAQRHELAKDAVKTLGKLGGMLIQAKFGVTSKEEGTPMQTLEKDRKTLFEHATDEDWALMKKHLGEKIHDRVKALESGEIDLVELDSLCDAIAGALRSDMKAAHDLLVNLTDEVSAVIMGIGDHVKAAKVEAAKGAA